MVARTVMRSELFFFAAIRQFLYCKERFILVILLVNWGFG